MPCLRALILVSVCFLSYHLNPDIVWEEDGSRIWGLLT